MEQKLTLESLFAKIGEQAQQIEALEADLKVAQAKGELADEEWGGKYTRMEGNLIGHPVCRGCGLPGGHHDERCRKARYDALALASAPNQEEKT